MVNVITVGKKSKEQGKSKIHTTKNLYISKSICSTIQLFNRKKPVPRFNDLTNLFNFSTIQQFNYSTEILRFNDLAIARFNNHYRFNDLTI